jgi:type I restriction enzyme M protein
MGTLIFDQRNNMVESALEDGCSHILFIDASNDFEKVKTQNQLTDDHVQKIISTYQSRTSIEKYSHLASIDEIKGNDYNLNIPRYVDTFEAEEAIDLTEVANKLKAIDQAMVDSDADIAKYCQQLGIAVPF